MIFKNVIANIYGSIVNQKFWDHNKHWFMMQNGLLFKEYAMLLKVLWSFMATSIGLIFYYLFYFAIKRDYIKKEHDEQDMKFVKFGI